MGYAAILAAYQALDSEWIARMLLLDVRMVRVLSEQREEGRCKANQCCDYSSQSNSKNLIAAGEVPRCT